jgi:hypothetical protein
VQNPRHRDRSIPDHPLFRANKGWDEGAQRFIDAFVQANGELDCLLLAQAAGGG